MTARISAAGFFVSEARMARGKSSGGGPKCAATPPSPERSAKGATLRRASVETPSEPERGRRGLLAALADDFRAHGESAIRAAREGNPATYLRLVGALVPKEQRPQRPLDAVSDDELA